jgi:putative ABC transport system permease protein
LKVIYTREGINMKKGLSVLLIVAALFGFYGGASSLTDVLACKDYWEKEGEKSTADMNKLEDGLNQLGDNEEAYLDGVKQVADGEVALEEGKQTLAQGEADYAAAPAKLRAGEAKLAAGKSAYADGKATYNAGLKEYNSKKAEFDKIVAKFNQLMDEKEGYPYWKKTYLASLEQAKTDPKKASCFTDEAHYFTIIPSKALEHFNEFAGNSGARKIVLSVKNDQLTAAYDGGDEKTKVGILMLKVKPGLENSKKEAEDALAYLKSIPEGQRSEKEKKKITELETITIPTINGALAGLDVYIPEMTYYATVLGLVSGREQMYNELVPVLEKMASDEETAKKINKLVPGGMKTIKAGLSNDGGLFVATMDKLIPVAQDVIKENSAKLAAAKKQLNDGAKKLKAAEKQIKKGEAELAQGYADYEAAPAKLAAGRQQLADGLKQLEEGKKQLAQYEDGEQQVRDGLATLMSTEPNGGLESILDRRGGDDEFDDANGHLDIQEGLDAVDVGRGYQADSGELITKEITNRAVGTAAGLGAAVLACLAALLSLIKKYKGAAVTAVLAAIAGVAGAVVGNGAGSEFSNIAGSTVGSLPWIAAGVVAAVACVFAIVNFTAKAE